MIDQPEEPQRERKGREKGKRVGTGAADDGEEDLFESLSGQQQFFCRLISLTPFLNVVTYIVSCGCLDSILKLVDG